ncbi:unnamed protein product, partial [Candidula unifasciata]
TDRLKTLYQEFGGSTSMHGIGGVLTTNPTWKRVMWSVVFLLGVGFSVYQFVLTMADYYSYPVTTVVTLKQENTAIFPAITICNLNQKRKSKMDESLVYATGTLEEVEASPDDAIMKGLLRQDFLDNGDVADHKISDMLIKCLFNKRRCSEVNFTRTDTATCGTCYTFEITDPLLQCVNRPGPQNGLTLEVNIELYEYLPVSIKAGVYVIVHSQDETPFPEDGGILAHPGVVTSIGIRQEITQRLPSPYSNCISANGQSSSQRSLFPNKRYMQNACLKSCLQMAVYESCKCCTVDLPCDYYKMLNVDKTTINANRSLRLCESFEEYLCELTVEDQFLKSELGCGERCPPACDRTTFDTVVSSALWPSDLTSKSFLKTVNGSLVQNMSFTNSNSFERFVQSNFLRLEIFLNSMEFKEFTTQAKYDWNLLLGTVGGLLGLWLGFSLLTAMEIVEVLIDTVIYCTHGRGKQTNTQIE